MKTKCPYPRCRDQNQPFVSAIEKYTLMKEENSNFIDVKALKERADRAINEIKPYINRDDFVQQPRDFFRTISIDKLGPYSLNCRGYRYIYFITDKESRWVDVEFSPVHNAEEVFKILSNFINRYGIFLRLEIAADDEFIQILNHKIKQFKQSYGITGEFQILSRELLIENTLLCNCVDRYLNSLTNPSVPNYDWDHDVNKIVYWYKCFPQKCISNTPFYILYKKVPNENCQDNEEDEFFNWISTSLVQSHKQFLYNHTVHPTETGSDLISLTSSTHNQSNTFPQSI